MDFSQKFSKYVKAQLHEEGRTITYLAKKVNVSRSHMYHLISNRKGWSQDLINRVCEVLSIEIIFTKAS